MSDQGKSCSVCGTLRHIDYFAIDRFSSDGHTSVCVACAQPAMWATVQELKGEFLALQALQTEVVKGAVSGAERMKAHLKLTTKAEKHEPWFWVLFEYMYLFLHLIDRIARKQLGSDTGRQIHERLVPGLITTFIQSLCGFLSKDEQDELCIDVVNRFAEADLEYTQCVDLIKKEDPFSSNYVFSVLASRLISLSNNENDPLKFTEILFMSFDTYGELNLENLVLGLGREIRTSAITQPS